MVSGVIFDPAALKCVIFFNWSELFDIVLAEASKPGVLTYSAYTLIIWKPLEATFGSNLTPKPFSVSFPRTHYQGQ